jgi:Xaa-Pro aminopeptidase
MVDYIKPSGVVSADEYKGKILPLRQRAEVQNAWLMERLETVLPEVMEREGFDMWIVVAREANEDPVYFSLAPEPALYARRRTILLFHRKDDGSLERLMVYKTGFKGFYEGVWKPDEEGQYECLGRIVRERDPKVIGVNVSETTAYGDGLTHGEYLLLKEALGEEYMARVKGAERLAVGWLERRTPGEIAVYETLVEIDHAIIAEAFSTRMITPGVTTSDDVAWWMRQKIRDLGLMAWFQPSVTIHAPDIEPGLLGRRNEKSRKVIKHGDLLHCDIGFKYLGLCTDVQENAYVLKPGEVDAPEGLRKALAEGNRLQDIHAEAMAAGRTGNEILKMALEKAKSEGLNASIYTHPIGFHGHAAGPIIGLWDHQEGVPGRGDYELFEDTCHSIELNVKSVVPEWGGMEVRMALEEDAVFTGGKLRFLAGRQTKLHLI